jgi:hypothetical protein
MTTGPWGAVVGGCAGTGGWAGRSSRKSAVVSI